MIVNQTAHAVSNGDMGRKEYKMTMSLAEFLERLESDPFDFPPEVETTYLATELF